MDSAVLFTISQARAVRIATVGHTLKPVEEILPRDIT